MLGLLFGCKSSLPEEPLTWKARGKVLVVCYSESKNQNTLTVAQWIQEVTGGTLLQLQMKQPYGDSYRQVLKEARQHLDSGTLPEILPLTEKLEDYETIFIGSPVWYGTYAPPVGTFMKGHDFSGKTVIPFCTHGGGGVERTFDEMAKAMPGANVLPGMVVRGSNVVERTLGRGTADKASKAEVIHHLNGLVQ